MNVTTTRATAVALITWVLHFIWEMAQARFFASMWNLPVVQATRWCAGAAGWDVVIQILAYSVAALGIGDRSWALRRALSPVPVGIYLATGLTITVLIERWAILTGHWAYAPSMPLVAGIGLTPLLQWVIVPVLVLVAIRWVMRARRVVG